MNLNRQLESLPEFETGYSGRREALLLAAVLVVGLAFVTPILAVVVGLPTLVGVALTGLIYGTLVLVFRRVLVGSLVGFIVTSTFAANVPLAGRSYTAEVVGHLGPEVWLAQIPLALALVLVFATGPREILAGATRVDLLFTMFVGWTVVAAVFGATARVDVALWFSWFMLNGLATFALLRHVVWTGVLSFRSVTEVLMVAVCAHATVGFAQLANSETFGLSFLGAGPPAVVATLSFGPFGDLPIGTFISGFTGMSFLLASFIVLTAPALIALTLRVSGWRRWVLVGTTLMLIAVLRVTGTDAGRGAFVVGIVSFVGVLIVLHRRELYSLSAQNGNGTRALRNIIPIVFALLTGIIALFYPSSGSGNESSISNLNVGSGSAGGSAGSTGGGAGSTGGGAGSTGGGAGSTGGGAGSTGGGAGSASPEPGIVESTLRELSIPFFDIAALGIRLQQYVIGLDLFIQYPIFGIGGANFAYVATEYGLPREMELHNIYIALLAETGLPGFVLYVTALLMVLWYGWQTIMTERTEHGRLLLVGILSGMVGYLAFGFWDHLQLTKITTFLSFWILAGAVVGEYQRGSSGVDT
jgi:hypothetical protein